MVGFNSGNLLFDLINILTINNPSPCMTWMDCVSSNIFMASPPPALMNSLNRNTEIGLSLGFYSKVYIETTVPKTEQTQGIVITTLCASQQTEEKIENDCTTK